MPRLPRLHVPGGCYHVILRGNHREDLFATADDRYQLNGIVAQVMEKYQARAQEKPVVSVETLQHFSANAEVIDWSVCRLRIPRHAGHRFHRMSVGDSTACRSLVPR
jgi:REP element-mobilizing transposase RayT